MNKPTPGAVRISKIVNYDGPDAIRIEIEDRVSGCKILTVGLDLKGLALALTGQGNAHGQIIHANLGAFLKIREVKEELVFVPNHRWADRESAAAQSVNLHEVDGWKGRIVDAQNHHRHVKTTDEGSTYRVSFTRFIDPTPEQLDARIKELEADDAA